MCEQTPISRTRLASVEAPRQARAVVRDSLCRAHAEAAEAAVELVASELVTESVRHGAPPLELFLHCQVSHVAVEVTDGGPWRPLTDDARSDLSWVLVAKIARAWGGEPVPTGRRLWCTVPSGGSPVGDELEPRRHRIVRLASS